MRAALDEVELFYTDAGDGPAVLLLHGWSCDSHDWSWLIADLVADHRVIAVDLRGHGRSQVLDGPYNPQVMAADALQLLRRLDVTSVAVVGHSMGTIVASALALAAPELVAGLVLVDPVYGVPVEVAQFLSSTVTPESAVGFAVASFQDFYRPLTPEFLKVWHARRVEGTPPHVLAQSLLGLYEGPGGLGRADVTSVAFADRAVPALAVYAAESGAEFERALPHADQVEVVVWPENGHFLHQERPAEFNALARAWLTARGL